MATVHTKRFSIEQAIHFVEKLTSVSAFMKAGLLEDLRSGTSCPDKIIKNFSDEPGPCPAKNSVDKDRTDQIAACENRYKDALSALGLAPRSQ